MRLLKKIASSQKIRFGIVGVLNTLLNFLILNSAFYYLGTSKIISSVIATVCAVTMSFFLNRGFVFQHRGRSMTQPLLFVAVTISGVILVQNSVYALLVYILKNHLYGLIKLIHTLAAIKLSNDFLDINLSNLIASLFAMVWNYNGYRLFVFKKNESYEASETSA